MLTRSFSCFHGISVEAERHLWKSGCLSWDYLRDIQGLLSPRKVADLVKQQPELQSALSGRVADYFIKRLPVGHRMRVWSDFHTGIGFLDVETSGLDHSSELTVIGLWQAGQMLRFVRDINLYKFLEALGGIEVLVTFNGKRFDWPVISKTFGLSNSPPHIDLMHEARVFGLAGGLKEIEHKIGFTRLPEEDGDGESAAGLWSSYVASSRNGADLEKLLKYNDTDVRSLILLSRVLLKRSFDGYQAPLPSLPPSPYSFHSVL